jgi:uncharacterized membrane protein|tara:strand:- start:31059 stop:31307 length:249 start_codon:yes stop_codon:yes gene_type:complete
MVMVVVRGDVRDRATGEALPWTLVFVGDARVFTDERGEYEVVVPKGTYVCGIRHSYYEPLTVQNVEVNDEKEIRFTPIRARL